MTTRTLHLIDGLGTGGAERSLAELLTDLPAHDVEPTVAVFHRRPEGVEEDVRLQGIDIRVIDDSTWMSRTRAVRSLVKELGSDVLHTSIFDADLIGRAAAAGTSCKVLTSLVNTSYEPERLLDPAVSRLRLGAAQAIDGVSGRLLTEHFHAVSHAVKDSAVRRLRIPEDRITVVPRGRKRGRLGRITEERRRQVRANLEIPFNAYVLLHVGREEHQKDHATLLKATAPVLRRYAHTHLVLAGRRGNASRGIDQALAMTPSSRVHRLGHVDVVPDLLAAADLFVFPSRYEGIAGAALEAMAMGVPTVVSDIPPHRELLQGIADFVPPGDSSALESAIETAMANGPDRRKTVLGLHRFEHHYDHAAVTAAMARLFHATAS